MDYDYAIDVWSIGCTLFELFTGKILFPGENNNQMLKLMMELRGRMYPKYYKRGQMWPHHFDDRDNFVSVSRDKITNRVSGVFRCLWIRWPPTIFARNAESSPPQSRPSPDHARRKCVAERCDGNGVSA